MSNEWIVDTILFNIENKLKTEEEAVVKCAEFAQCGLLDFQYLQQKDENLHRKVMEWCKANPPPL